MNSRRITRNSAEPITRYASSATSDVAKAQTQATKYRNYDRSKIASDANTKASSTISRDGNRGGNRIGQEGTATAQGRILRQDDDNRYRRSGQGES